MQYQVSPTENSENWCLKKGRMALGRGRDWYKLVRSIETMWKVSLEAMNPFTLKHEMHVKCEWVKW